MKKILRLLTVLSVLLVATVFLVACGGSSSGSAAVPPTTTVLVYLEGTNLESDDASAKNNITEMLAASSSQNLKVVLTTGAADKAVAGEDVDNWREVRRYIVNNHKLVEIKGQRGILDMGNPQTLTDFITWGQDTYPADKYVLVFWDHGGGALGGFGGNKPDPTNSSFAGAMSIAQLKEGVESAIKGRPERRFELIGFDACLMATIEVADAFKDLGRYLAASQEIEPGAGWNWTAFLNHIVSNPGTDGASIGATIADSYGAKMNNEDTGAIITFSVIDLAKVPRINSALATFSNTYKTLLAGSNSLPAWNNLASSRSHALDFTNYLEMVDLIDMFDSEPLASAEVTELKNATRDAVVKKVSGPYRKEASGLSVMFPSFAVWNPEKQLKTYGNLEFFVPEYRALVNSFSTYARTSVPDTTFGAASLSTDAKTMSARITSPNPRYEQVYVAINKKWDVVNDKQQTVTEDVYLGLQPVWSTSGDASEFSYTSNSKWFMLNGKLASVIAEPTSERGEQIVKIPLRVERTGGKDCTIYTCLDGMYYLLYNFDTDKLVETIGFVAEANNQVNPAQQLRKDDVVFLRYFVMPDSTQVMGSWKAINSDEYTFTMGSTPPAFEKAAIPLGSDYAFFGFDLRWKQFVSSSVKLQ
ncbi:MAG: clostripain-related cysteine peptidase [Syntrophales bacterium]